VGAFGNFILVLAMLTAAILVHEIGHFIAARLFGVRVLTFSIGMPPRLFGVKRGDTDYVVSAIPVGGYVKLAGDDWGEGEPAPDELMAKPWWARIGIYVAGVSVNIVFAYLIFFASIMNGVEIQEYLAVIGPVAARTEAARAGLKAGDRAVRAAGREVRNWDDLADAIGTGIEANKRVTVEFARGGRRVRAVFLTATLTGLVPGLKPVIGSVAPALPARKAGLMKGDRVVAVDGHTIRWWSEMSERISKAKPDVAIAVQVMREGKPMTFTVKPRWDAGQGRSIIGVNAMPSSTELRRFPVTQALKYAGAEVYIMGREIVVSFWRLLRGKAKFQDVIGGPVLITQVGMEKAREGIWELLHFMGVLNVGLCVANLLPLPVVDGGMILMAFVEGIRRRRFSPRVYNVVNYVGVVLLVLIMLTATYHDILRWLF